MSTFDTTKRNLLETNRHILTLVERARSIPGISKNPFDGWEKVGASIEEQIEEETLRVAVVGAIKSGKSTFSNAFLGGDYLKRGAGVVTSIVTRIRKSPRLKAVLDFKTWDEVNTDMQQAMVLFPSLEWHQGDKPFDVRRDDDREGLTRALRAVSSEKLISQETLDANSVLLTSYLRGYDRVKDLLSYNRNRREFAGEEFGQHRDFVGNDSLALYLKDLELHIPGGKNLDDNIEIADCQGIDSLNPLHLAMIQDYLLRTHLIIYLLSSRTGIRQADVKFLTIIKKMGLLENIFFIVNCDFNEHENLEDLQKVVERVREEVSVIKSRPTLFAFSALYDLLGQLGSDLSPRDRMRLDQWEHEKVFVEYSEGESERFHQALTEKLTQDRFTLLLKNHLERVSIMAGGLHDWTTIHRDILRKDSEDARELLIKIEKAGDQLNQQKALIKDTLDGTAHKMKRDLGRNVDRFLDARYGDMSKDIYSFIKKYGPDTEKSERDLAELGFSTTLYMVFQDFKRALDRFMAENINPRLIEFIRHEEKKIDERLTMTADSYDTLVRDALQKHEETLRKLGITSVVKSVGEIHSMNLESIKRRALLSAPPLASTLHYTAKIRTEAIMRLGFYKVVKMMKKMLKKPIQNEQEGEIFALKDGIKRIKQETERSVVFHLQGYKENLKYQYLYKLVDIVSVNLHDMLQDRFNVFTSDISEMVGLVDTEQSGKEEAIEILQSMEEGAREALDRIGGLKKQIGH